MSSPRALLVVLGGLAAAVLLFFLLQPGEATPVQATAVGPEPGWTPPSRPVEPPSVRVPGAVPAAGEPQPAAAPTRQSRRDTPAAEVRGRCVERSSGAPLPGVEVHLVVWGQEPLATRSDALGAFSFPSPGNTVSWVEVRRPAPWLLDRPRVRLSPEQRLGEEPVVLTLARAASLAGRVVDASTGDPVPGVSVHVREDEGYDDEVTTGADGSFSSVGRVREQSLSLSVRDAGSYLVVSGTGEPTTVVRWTPADLGPLELEVEIGPTYRLRVLGDEGRRPARLRARLVQELDDGGEVAWSWVRLREEPPGSLRLRYSQRPPGAPARGPGRLEVRTTDGRRAGSGPVESSHGVHPGVVEVELRPAGRVSGRVVDARGEAIEDARVHAAPLANGVPDRDESRWVVGRTSARGAFTLEPVFPGDYRLVAVAAGAPPLERDLRVPTGGRDLGDLVLEGEVAGAVWAILRYDASSGPLRAYVRLVPADGAGVARTTQPEIDEEESGPVGVAGFEHVVEGSYVLEIVSTDHHRWSPARIPVSPPAGPLEFARVEGDAGVRLGFRPTDAETGRPVPEFFVRLRVGSTWEPGVRRALWGEVLEPVPAGAPLTWTLEAPAYRPVHGTEADFAAAGEEGRGLFATPLLERGWGARIHVRDAAGFHASLLTDPTTYRSEALRRPALEGVTVLADGVPVGVTDAAGLVDVELPAAPGRLDLRREGWRVVDSPFLHDGRLPTAGGEGIVWMLRD